MNIRKLIISPISQPILERKEFYIESENVNNITFGELKLKIAEHEKIADVKRISTPVQGKEPKDSEKVYPYMLAHDIKSIRYRLLNSPKNENSQNSQLPLQDNNKKVPLFVKTLTGKIISIYVTPTATLREIREIIRKQENFKDKYFRLTVAGKQYPNNTRLVELVKIPEEQDGLNFIETIHLVTDIEPPKLLVLDVEGTIIHGYVDQDPDEHGNCPAKIHPELATVLKELHKKGFKIVLNTGTTGQQLDHYMKEFSKSGISDFIYVEHDKLGQTFYIGTQPKLYTSADDKVSKLNKYCDQFVIDPIFKKNVYFYDDGAPNVSRAKEAGFINSYVVNDNVPLYKQLQKLLKSQPSNTVNNSIFTQNIETLQRYANNPNITVVGRIHMPPSQWPDLSSQESGKLSIEHYNKIRTMAQTLEKEINSFWPYPNKDRKKIKIEALANLVTNVLNDPEKTLTQHVDAIRVSFPSVDKGIKSHRVRDLLDELKNAAVNRHNNDLS